ncbi:hypothetical protein BPAE_0050g00520 [Botrytis paeoniae]|uniref:Uncharacterized protein n=1 Tax=Botrytis paeoniae TaxID=278948 RepID=A0A4Z1FXT1_9HELO|nr:hypothetical protein BPAE_0050g00520 [Botrytis paeoniae]
MAMKDLHNRHMNMKLTGSKVLKPSNKPPVSLVEKGQNLRLPVCFFRTMGLLYNVAVVAEC